MQRFLRRRTVLRQSFTTRLKRSTAPADGKMLSSEYHELTRNELPPVVRDQLLGQSAAEAVREELTDRRGRYRRSRSNLRPFSARRNRECIPIESALL